MEKITVDNEYIYRTPSAKYSLDRSTCKSCVHCFKAIHRGGASEIDFPLTLIHVNVLCYIYTKERSSNLTFVISNSVDL